MDALVHSSASQSLQTSGMQESPGDLPADAAPSLWARVNAGGAWLGAIALSAALAAPGVAWAAATPELYVGIGHSSDGGCLGVPLQRESTGPIRARHDCAYDNTHSWASAEADYGSLSSWSRGESSRANSLVISGSSTAGFKGDYIFTFIGPDPEVNTSFTTHLNLVLDGRLSLFSLTPDTLANADVGVTVEIPTQLRRERTYVQLHKPLDSRLTEVKKTTGPGWGYEFLDGEAGWEALAGPAGAHLDLETRDFTVTTGQPVTIDIQLFTGFFIRNVGGADSDFASTLTFNRDEVFELPEGYTVNGPGVVNNHWVGAIPAVPEPATALLSALGLGVVSWRVRRRRVTWTRG